MPSESGCSFQSIWKSVNDYFYCCVKVVISRNNSASTIPAAIGRGGINPDGCSGTEIKGSDSILKILGYTYTYTKDLKVIKNSIQEFKQKFNYNRNFIRQSFRLFKRKHF